jgi:hypothetical protein
MHGSRELNAAWEELHSVLPVARHVPWAVQTRLYKKPEIDDFSHCRERAANSHVGLGDVGKIDCRAFHEEIADQLIVDARFK